MHHLILYQREVFVLLDPSLGTILAHSSVLQGDMCMQLMSTSSSSVIIRPQIPSGSMPLRLHTVLPITLKIAVVLTSGGAH